MIPSSTAPGTSPSARSSARDTVVVSLAPDGESLTVSRADAPVEDGVASEADDEVIDAEIIDE